MERVSTYDLLVDQRLDQYRQVGQRVVADPVGRDYVEPSRRRTGMRADVAQALLDIVHAEGYLASSVTASTALAAVVEYGEVARRARLNPDRAGDVLEIGARSWALSVLEERRQILVEDASRAAGEAVMAGEADDDAGLDLVDVRALDSAADLTESETQALSDSTGIRASVPESLVEVGTVTTRSLRIRRDAYLFLGRRLDGSHRVGPPLVVFPEGVEETLGLLAEGVSLSQAATSAGVASLADAVVLDEVHRAGSSVGPEAAFALLDLGLIYHDALASQLADSDPRDHGRTGPQTDHLTDRLRDLVHRIRSGEAGPR